MKTSKQQILDEIDIVEFYKEYYPDWSGDENDLVTCPKSERHEGDDDSTPSLSIEPGSGAFLCNGCRWKGTSPIGFFTDTAHGGDYKRAIRSLYNRYCRPIFPAQELSKYRKHLSAEIRSKILSIRGWSDQTLREFRLGFCPTRGRVVIPIYNISGHCIDLRFHDTIRKAELKNGKRVSMLAPKGGRKGDWFPISPNFNPFDISTDTVWLFEGEPDVILATQDGINCATLTGGAGVWSTVPYETLKPLVGKHVVVCFDNDKAGRSAASSLVERLAGVDVKSVKKIFPPEGKDITDYFLRHNGGKSTLVVAANQAPYDIQPKKTTAKTIPLDETSLPQNIGKPVSVNVLINGKNNSPLSIPKRVKFQCRASIRCDSCPCSESGVAEHVILDEDPAILNWVYGKTHQDALREDLGMARKCNPDVRVEEWQSLEPVTMIPTPSTRESSNRFVTRRGFYLGHGIEPNRNYIIRAIPLVHPKSKESLLLVGSAKGAHDSIHDFHLTEEQVEDLKETFNGDPKVTMGRIAETFSKNHTRIYGRPDLHTAIDLAFHSPREFNLANTPVPKGSIELVVFGDPTCGKGQIAEGLIKLYDLGVVVSGENASFMGLVGGAQKTDRGFELVWGRFPTNHGRLVIVDEFSGFSDLGRLSRIRSEGIAELDKAGIHACTEANTRIVWIANCRKGRPIGAFPSGVEALEDLVRAQEDIRRFDLALAVSKGEVNIEEINRGNQKEIRTRFTPGRLRKVCLWAWSRTRDQIHFSNSATDRILSGANELSQRYSSSIPLIQGENARFKIAKVAAAIAARCFNTDDGTNLLVTEEHTETAIEFIKRLYDSPTMGYKTYSEIERGGRELERLDELDKFIDGRAIHLRRVLVDGLLSMQRFAITDLMDWCSVDGTIARKNVSTLVKCRAVKQSGKGLYIKKPAFTAYLHQKKKSLSNGKVSKTHKRKKAGTTRKKAKRRKTSTNG